MSKSGHIMFRVERVKLNDGREVGALVPMFATDLRIMRERGYRVGDQLRASLAKPRAIGRHYKAHKLGVLISTNLDRYAGLGSHAAIKRLQADAGVCCDPELIDARPVVDAVIAAAVSLMGERVGAMLRAVLPALEKISVLSPRSIAFDRMDQGEFDEFYRGLCQHLIAVHWPDMTEQQIADMAEMME